MWRDRSRNTATPEMSGRDLRLSPTGQGGVAGGRPPAPSPPAVTLLSARRGRPNNWLEKDPSSHFCVRLFPLPTPPPPSVPRGRTTLYGGSESGHRLAPSSQLINFASLGQGPGYRALPHPPPPSRRTPHAPHAPSWRAPHVWKLGQEEGASPLSKWVPGPQACDHP